MGDVINLRTARKTRARKDREKVADGNRLKFGRTKIERLKDAQESLKQSQAIEGHKREQNSDGEKE